jgi:probable selenium-dependent hydroxylase accessory protein YqeC
MPCLSAWFEDFLLGSAVPAAAKNKPAIVSVIGSGGKTSLIWHLAASFAPGRRILVTPATKMFVPPRSPKLYNRFYDASCDKAISPGSGKLSLELASGVTLAGRFNKASGKLESLPPKNLENFITGFDLVLIEGDGSKGLPLKAWAEEEPVVPPLTDFTIGVLPLWPLGQPVSEKIIHRLPLFIALTGAVPGGTIKLEHILRLITGRVAEAGKPDPSGLFAKARGKKVLFFNQIEGDNALKQARELTEALPTEFCGSLSGIIAGSARLDILYDMKKT